MNTSTIEAPGKDDIILLDRLTKLLEEQINTIHHSDIGGKKVEYLAEKAQDVVKEISQKHLLDLEQLTERREQIRGLYISLNLAIIARKDETEKQLNQIRKGRKSLVTYRSNI
ncbi:MAG: hypothetical protein P8016_01365 [Sedimentisphaerales bacterium]|jgi:hypothetical protein